jgi:hypothetical protein
MTKKRKHWILYLLKFIFHLIWIVLLLVLVYISFTYIRQYLLRYTPAETEAVEHTIPTAPDEVFFIDEYEVFARILSWDIGNGIKGHLQENYRDGGQMSKPEKDDFQTNLQGIISTLGHFDYVDFILLQNVDTGSNRSYYVNQHQMITTSLPEHGHGFSLNAASPFVAWPPFKPEGKIQSGISIFAKLPFEELTRYAFPKVLVAVADPLTETGCFQLARFNLKNGTQLVIFNIQNAFFKMTPEHRLSRLMMIKSQMLHEYANGNFVVAGGCWAVNPSGFDITAFTSGDAAYAFSVPMEQSFFPMGWQIAFDKEKPGYRMTDKIYTKGKTPCTIIDFFIVSPNVEINNCKTIMTGFEYSNHNPIMLEIYIPLKEENPILFD